MTAPLTEVEAQAWADRVKEALDDCDLDGDYESSARGVIASALLAANRGDIPSEVRPPADARFRRCESCDLTWTICVCAKASA